MRAHRFREAAAATLREAITQAGGIEVFAIGEVDGEGLVSALTIHCRGNAQATPALLTRPRAGQVVIHNHPSGVMQASEADLHLASRYGDEGVGVVIVDNPVARDLWVVEPHRPVALPVDSDRLDRLFEEDLRRVIPGHEVRPQQVEMARAVAGLLGEGGLLLAEAGTGTGKSLAYLAPAVLWALENDSKVVVSTYTRNLQSQILGADLPLLRQSGLEFEVALLKGRGNYLCRRKLGLALEDPGDDGQALEALEAWSRTSLEGSLQDYGEVVDTLVWDRVESHTDQTLRARCPHYNTCFYYQSRRQAAASHLLVVNHALLLADLWLKADGGDGLLPRYGRVIIDEGHHLADAATQAVSGRLGALAITRAIAPLLPRKKRRGVLQRITEGPGVDNAAVSQRCTVLTDVLRQLKEEVPPAFELIGDLLLEDAPQARITGQVEESAAWQTSAEAIRELCRSLGQAADRIEILEGELGEAKLPVAQLQLVLDLATARRRLQTHRELAGLMLESERGGWCRWVEGKEGSASSALLQSAPVNVGPLLSRLLWDPLQAVVVTSATLAVSGRFDHYREIHGIEEAQEACYPSPFDYRRQAVLGLPKDLPRPGDEGYLQACAELGVKLVELTGGGAFVLCTSFEMVRWMAEALERAVGDRIPILVHGRSSREKLLSRFQRSQNAVLVGTDSFWEGVSVPGDGLRLVVIPRLPFRVPTHPVAQARYEFLKAQGRDPFLAWSLPEAVVKLRQGFGRLVRTQADRGAVVLLDRRIHDMRYGRVFLRSLPPAERYVGPSKRVLERLDQFYGRDTRPPGEAEE